MNDFIIHAYEINGSGGSAQLEADKVSKAIKSDHLAWVHLDAGFSETRNWLVNEIDYLDSIVIDALLAEETRPRVMEFKDGVALILRGVNLNGDSQPEDMVSIRVWVDEHRIISVQKRPLKAIRDIAVKFDAGQGGKNSGDFVAMLTAGLFAKMEPVFSELDETLDDIEERILECSDPSERKVINTIRKQAIIFRRYVAPQRDAIAFLRNSDMTWLDNGHRRKLQESQDRLIRYVEDLDSIRERAQIVKEEIATMLSDAMNKNMYVLSVIAAIFLPLGFLTGLLGVNVGGIPGTENPLAFTIFSLVLVVLVAAQIAFFKFKKWF